MIKMVGYDMTREGRPRRSTRRPASAPRTSTSCELHDCFTANEILTYEGARPLQGGRGREVHLGGRQHLRRQGRDQPVGRPALEGPPARRDRPRAVHRARLAAPRHGRQAPGRGRQGRPPAQPRPRRRLRRDDVPPRLSGFGYVRANGSRGPEILAPAGNAEALRAAVRAGADAVYFGLQGFNARARADELRRRRARGHHALPPRARRARLRHAQHARLRRRARRRSRPPCGRARTPAPTPSSCRTSASLRLVRAIAPDLPIHASTQMTCTDAASVVELAGALGASRVILARELSLEDIAGIRAETDVELEVFVHGALCVAYSGQCLTSEAIGGRSANRGACAQACRLPYELVVDGELRDLGDRAYLLSPEDLEASALVPELVQLGVRALKIEGRLKGPEYVGRRRRALYREAVAAALGEGAAPGERRAARRAPDVLARLGPRLPRRRRSPAPRRGARVRSPRRPRGHALRRAARARARPTSPCALEAPLALGDGILVEGGFAGEGEIGGRVWASSVRRRERRARGAGRRGARLARARQAASRAPPPAGGVWKTSDPALRARDRARASSAIRTASPLDVRVSGRFGEPLVLEATSARGAAARVVGDAPLEPARSSPLTAEAPARQARPPRRHALRARRAHDRSARGRHGPDLVAQPRAPRPRRRAARRRRGARLAHDRGHRTRTSSPRPRRPIARPLPAGLFVLCRTLPQAEAAIDAGAAGVYLDFLELTGTGAAVRALRARGAAHVALAPPRIRKPGEEKIDRYLDALVPDALLVRSLGALAAVAPRPGARRPPHRRLLAQRHQPPQRRRRPRGGPRRLHALVRPRRRAAPRAARLAPSPRSPRWSCTTRCRSSTWSTA